MGPNAVPPQQAVLMLSESRQRHVEDALLAPACATTIKAGRRRQLKLPSWEGVLGVGRRAV
jgi:hypothetical protein